MSLRRSFIIFKGCFQTVIKEVNINTIVPFQSFSHVTAALFLATSRAPRLTVPLSVPNPYPQALVAPPPCCYTIRQIT